MLTMWKIIKRNLIKFLGHECYDLWLKVLLEGSKLIHLLLWTNIELGESLRGILLGDD